MSLARADLIPAATLFRCLADPVRLAILRRLGHGEATVGVLVATLELAQSTVSQHLACLREGGLVQVRRDGRQSFYQLRTPQRLQDLFAAAQPLLDNRHQPANDTRARRDARAGPPFERRGGRAARA